MKPQIMFKALFLILITICPAFSADLESLVKEGYQIAETTAVVGEFKGCLATAPLRFTNGKAFACTTFSYSYSVYMPQVNILKNDNNDIKVLINGTIYSGTLIEQGK